MAAAPVAAQPQSLSASVAAYERKEVRDLTLFVQEAAGEVSKRGEAAFADFNVRGGRWYQGDNYVVVFDTAMVRVVFPPAPARVGDRTLPYVDADGRPYAVWMKQISDRGPGASGWVHYRLDKAGGEEHEWRNMFLMKARSPAGKDYLLGGGIYGVRPEKKFIQDFVEEAAALVAKEGEKAFPRFRDKKGQFFYRDIYIFVYTFDGVCMVQPAVPELEGDDLSTHRDPKGNLDVLSVIAAARKGGGWRAGWLPRPGFKTPQKKLIYVLPARHGDVQYAVGSGLYR